MKSFLLLLAFLVAVPAAAQLRFEPKTAHVGTISEDDAPREVTFRFVNDSDTPVVIKRVETTCGCTKPRYSKAPVLPGAKGTLSVFFNPKGQPGTLNRSVYVHTSASATPVKLTLTGEVTPTKDLHPEYPYRIGALRLKQTEVRFGVVRAPMRAMARIEVVNEGSRPLRLSLGGAPVWVEFRTEPAVIKPDSVGDMVFICNPQGLEPGKIQAEAMLDGVIALPSERLLKFSAEIR